MADDLKKRIAALEMAEAMAAANGKAVGEKGGMTPEAQAELDQYRSKGLAKGTGAAASGATTEDEKKSNGFLIRALGANKAYEGSGAGPRSLPGQVFYDWAPDTANYFSNPDRQVADAAQREFVQAILRRDSGANTPEPELKNYILTYFPRPGDGAAVIEEKRQARLRAIQGLYSGAGRALTPDVKTQYEQLFPQAQTAQPGAPVTGPGTPSATPAAPEQFDASANPYAGVAGSPQSGVTASVTSTPKPQMVSSELDQRYATALQLAFNKGAKPAELDALAAKFGYPPPSSSPAFAKWINDRDKNGVYGPVNVPRTQVDVPTAATKALAPAFNSTAGAATTGFFNGITSGGLDEIGGAVNAVVNGKDLQQSIAEADYKKQLLREAYPTAFGTGEVAGGVAQGVIAGGALGMAGRGAAANLAFDTGLGAAYGAGENNENRIGGAEGGAAAGLAGGVVGRVAPKIGGRLFGGNTNPDIRFLADKGVRTTPGMNVGLGDTEYRATKLPWGAGRLVSNARNQAMDDAQLGILNESLSPLNTAIPAGTKPGKAAMAYAQKTFDNAYDSARSQMSLVKDGQFDADLAALRTKLTDGTVDPSVGDRVERIIDKQIVGRLNDAGGTLDGASYKNMMTSLAGIRRTANGGKNPNFELADTIGDLMGALDGAARRSSAPDAVALLDSADEGYSLFVRAERAAAMRGGDTATFDPGQFDASVQAMDPSVRSRAYLRGDARGQDWAEALKNTMGDKVASADRREMSIGNLSPTILYAAGYLPGVRSAAGTMTRYGPIAPGIANWLDRTTPYSENIGRSTSSTLLQPWISQ